MSRAKHKLPKSQYPATRTRVEKYHTRHKPNTLFFQSMEKIPSQCLRFGVPMEDGTKVTVDIKFESDLYLQRLADVTYEDAQKDAQVLEPIGRDDPSILLNRLESDGKKVFFSARNIFRDEYAVPDDHDARANPVPTSDTSDGDSEQGASDASVLTSNEVDAFLDGLKGFQDPPDEDTDYKSPSP